MNDFGSVCGMPEAMLDELPSFCRPLQFVECFICD